MEFYTFILIVLFGTAIADLLVGVANDAVNFLNSAVGSKAASRRVIMIIASLGVLFGTTFSSGMMEIARKGIFNPELFVFHEVMIIFLAVMLTDILLLDLYNTFGLPTSTTVSIVFEILGGSIAIATIKIARSGEDLFSILSYINTAKVIAIIGGIGLSIVFAFAFGSVIQFITRLIFTFNYEKAFKRVGAIYCGIALSVITYFIIVKGAKGSSLLTDQNSEWIMAHLSHIMLFSFLAWTVIWQILISFTKINVLKGIVLMGTFALALSFAANDLVNFIGAPLAALGAYQISLGNPGSDPLALTMEALRNPVRTNIFILIASGAVMVATLWLSRKARTVTKTEVSLGRQEEGVERFESSALSRGIVRMSIALFEIVQKIIPKSIQEKIRERIDPDKFKPKQGRDVEPPAFDLLRAAVNLMVASALISFGTSLKLPLSTTFVTFMVAMSTSFSDKAWGRESAVYRVTGVLTVIGGWFFTAFMAFSTCFIFALFIYYVKLPAIIILMAFGFYFLLRSAKFHRQREDKFQRRERKRITPVGELGNGYHIILKMSHFIATVANVVEECCDGLIDAKRKKLKQTKKQTELLSSESDTIIDDIFQFLQSTAEEEKGAAPRYARTIGALQILTTNLYSFVNSSYTHIDNHHRPPDVAQAEELREINEMLTAILKKSADMLEYKKFSELRKVTQSLENLKATIQLYDKHQMKRIKSGKAKTRQSLLFVSTLSWLGRIAEQTVNLTKLVDESVKETVF